MTEPWKVASTQRHEGGKLHFSLFMPSALLTKNVFRLFSSCQKCKALKPVNSNPAARSQMLMCLLNTPVCTVSLCLSFFVVISMPTRRVFSFIKHQACCHLLTFSGFAIRTITKCSVHFNLLPQTFKYIQNQDTWSRQVDLTLNCIDINQELFSSNPPP